MRGALALALLSGCSLGYGDSFLCGTMPDGGSYGSCPSGLSCVANVCGAPSGTGSGTSGGSTGGTTGSTGHSTGSSTGSAPCMLDGGAVRVDDLLGVDGSCC